MNGVDELPLLILSTSIIYLYLNRYLYHYFEAVGTGTYARGTPTTLLLSAQHFT